MISITPYLDLILLSLILFLATILMFSADYIKSVIIMALISVLAATTYLVMSAPDVALTEAAVGACASTCILLVGLRHLKKERRSFFLTKKQLLLCGSICTLLLFGLCYYSMSLHQYGDPSALASEGVSRYYISNVEKDIGMKSLVTAILASYRGMDTLCETLVIFTAGMSVIFIFGYSILNKDEKINDK
jgi:multicomponent Na+:H+ antiporter subunit B